MRAVEFPEVNGRLAEEQAEYETLPIYLESLPDVTIVYACFELSKEEREELAKTGKLWYSRRFHSGQFEPFLITTEKPF